MPDSIDVDGVDVRSASSEEVASKSEIEGESALEGGKAAKDPRRIARRYQIDLCNKALEENVIVYLGTGSGKTHIAVLLIHEFRQVLKAPQKCVCIFLAPTVALVNQQATVIEESLDLMVGVHCGSSKQLNCHNDWEREISQKEILFMTPQTLLHTLSHSFITMDHIALLVLDECHHAQINSSHPYAEIMRVFYANHVGNVPRIFGMTASPIVGKGASSGDKLSININSLELLLDAKVYSVEKQLLKDYIASPPEVTIYRYDLCPNGTTPIHVAYGNKLEEIRQKYLSNIRKNAKDVKSFQSSTRLLSRFHDSIMFCLENLGVWGALQACQILLVDGDSEWDGLTESEEDGCDASVGNRYLCEVSMMLSSCWNGDGTTSDHIHVDNLKEPFFSTKMLCLIELLSSPRSQSKPKCMIFVNRIITARCMSLILKKITLLEFWKCDYLVGVNSGLKSMSRKNMKSILENFRNGKLNLLVATKVGEEGLDIQTCCLVIRFDIPETLSSFIQSRGRARMDDSKYVFLVNSDNQKELDMIDLFSQSEDRMNVDIFYRASNGSFASPVERVYKVNSSGACVTSGYSISLLHRYCSKLPHDEYYDPKPKFFYFDDMGLTVCHIILPASAPLHEIRSAPKPSKEEARKDACLNAIEKLHNLGALNSFLLPEQEVAANDSDSRSSLSVFIEDEDCPRKLYEMVVPTVLKNTLITGKSAMLYGYYTEFSPAPRDRNYKEFGIFFMSPLPQELEKSEIELYLGRGRSVIAKLIPQNSSIFTWNEIVLVTKFQELYLTVVLDRSDFVSEFVQLGKENPSSNSTFFLMLPVTLNGDTNEMLVDWTTIRNCLDSAVFKYSKDVTENRSCSTSQLHLANGLAAIDDIKNSLVYVPYKKAFFFIASTVSGRNAFSPLKCSSTENHVDHLKSKYKIDVRFPEQPLLRAKQLFCPRNLLYSRVVKNSELLEKEEYMVDLVPELCELKISAFSKEMGSSISLLPSIMHRLEGLLVANELKCLLCMSFAEGSKLTVRRVLEALTTEICQESFSLERLETLGDAYLKFVVTRSLFLSNPLLDEGELTSRRSNCVANENLFQSAVERNLQVFIRDQPLVPSQFFTVGRPCPNVCCQETCESIHSLITTDSQLGTSGARCNKGHHWLKKKTVADVVEALIGAFVLEGGFKAANAFLKWIGINVDYDAVEVSYACKMSTRCALNAPSIDIFKLENTLGYTFLHKGLLLQAFIHPSFNRCGGGCYQRLEFLGDAVLDYAVSSYLFSAYPELKPDLLTQLRSSLVNNRAFASVAIKQSFHRFLVCDSSSLSEAVRNYADFIGQISLSESVLTDEPKCPKALGDLVESCIGAIYLDSGLNLYTVWKIILSLLDLNDRVLSVQLNPLQELNELCQFHKWTLTCPVKKTGRYSVAEAQVNGENFSSSASASNSTKKEAVRIASELLLTKLKVLGFTSKCSFLDEHLKSTCKVEPSVIGCDDIPVDFASSSPNSFRSALPDASSSGPSCSELVDLCVSNEWRAPLLEESRVSDQFACKFVVYVENEILECFGAPQASKEKAAEHAAQAALWYLQGQSSLS